MEEKNDNEDSNETTSKNEGEAMEMITHAPPVWENEKGSHLQSANEEENPNDNDNNNITKESSLEEEVIIFPHHLLSNLYQSCTALHLN